MHAVVLESLEDYLSGGLKPAVRREFETHLSACDTCREELAGLTEISGLFASLRPQEAMEPAPGFYARVVHRLEERKPAPALSGWLALDLMFGRRLVFASLVMLAVLGGFLVSRETRYAVPASPSPESVMAQQNSPAFDSEPAENNMLVTLTAYEY
jgi:anti-sigma factor RsiW